MAFSEVPMPAPYSWTAAYECAIAESDLAQLHERVLAAEDAMIARALEIPREDTSAAAEEERQALREASDGLLKIKIERLGWRLQ
jgi:hypothetical protein